MPTGLIDIDDVGIASVLSKQLVVPLNQREYSWEDEHVRQLFDDLQRALDKSGSPVYFLGTIALTGPVNDPPEVTDGQQRLATIMLLLAAMRDYFHEKQNTTLVNWIQNNYLIDSDPDQGYVSRLALNVDDREFFAPFITSFPADPKRQVEAKRDSHKRIMAAAALAAARVKTICSAYTKESDRTNRLREWVNFLTNGAIIIKLRLANDLNAFKMFETLNDRGLRTSQVDIVKNYLFQQADDKMGDVQPKWSKMVSVLEGLDIDDIAVHFLRHFMMYKHGAIHRDDVFQRIEETVSGKRQTIDFVNELAEAAADYDAVLTSGHKKWNSYSPYTNSLRMSIKTIRELGVAQIRPLLLAVARQFDKKETELAFRRFVSWTVRFLIAGGGRGQALENAYAKAANDIQAGRAKSVSDLASSLSSIVPKDPDFESAFSIARVSKSHLARYYLRSLEMKRKGVAEPEWIPNDDQVINLEHIMPENTGANWRGIDEDTAQAFFPRIGNMVLMQASKNSTIGNAKFSDKRDALKNSTYLLTSEVAKQKTWGPAEINERQKDLAKLAVETWPLQ
jgi:hypothetical protein